MGETGFEETGMEVELQDITHYSMSCNRQFSVPMYTYAYIRYIDSSFTGTVTDRIIEKNKMAKCPGFPRATRN